LLQVIVHGLGTTPRIKVCVPAGQPDDSPLPTGPIPEPIPDYPQTKSP